jgi:hypothetical protein
VLPSEIAAQSPDLLNPARVTRPRADPSAVDCGALFHRTSVTSPSLALAIASRAREWTNPESSAVPKATALSKLAAPGTPETGRMAFELSSKT